MPDKIFRWLKENHLFLLFFLLFFTLFFNVRYYFLQDWSYVVGRLVEYRYPALFLTDIVGLGLVFGYLLQSLNRDALWLRLKNFLSGWGIPIYLFLMLICFLPPIQTFEYFVLRFGFYSLLFFVLKDLVSRKTFGIFLKQNLNILLALLSLAMAFQFVPFILYSFDAGCDICTKIGGINHLIQKLGVSHVTILDRSFPRNYGFFPHPNVLGGLVAIITSALLYFQARGNLVKVKKTKILLGLSIILAILLLFSTFSVAAMIGLGLAVLIFGITIKKLRIVVVPAVLALVALCFYMLVQKDETHINLRLELLAASWDLFKKAPLTGVGPLEFVRYIARYKLQDANGLLLLQPVHNVFVLVLTEFGLILGGFSLYKFFALLYSRYKLIGTSILIAVLPFLTILMLDHYLFTLNQGILLSVFFLAAISQKFKQKP